MTVETGPGLNITCRELNDLVSKTCTQRSVQVIDKASVPLRQGRTTPKPENEPHPGLRHVQQTDTFKAKDSKKDNPA